MTPHTSPSVSTMNWTITPTRPAEIYSWKSVSIKPTQEGFMLTATQNGTLLDLLPEFGTVGKGLNGEISFEFTRQAAAELRQSLGISQAEFSEKLKTGLQDLLDKDFGIDTTKLKRGLPSITASMFTGVITGMSDIPWDMQPLFADRIALNTKNLVVANTNLDGFDLRSGVSENCVFASLSMRDSKHAGRIYKQCTWSGVNADRALFRADDIVDMPTIFEGGCSFARKCKGVRLDYGATNSFQGASFFEADLGDLKLDGSNLIGADLRGARHVILNADELEKAAQTRWDRVIFGVSGQFETRFDSPLKEIVVATHQSKKDTVAALSAEETLSLLKAGPLAARAVVDGDGIIFDFPNGGSCAVHVKDGALQIRLKGVKPRINVKSLQEHPIGLIRMLNGYLG